MASRTRVLGTLTLAGRAFDRKMIAEYSGAKQLSRFSQPWKIELGLRPPAGDSAGPMRYEFLGYTTEEAWRADLASLKGLFDARKTPAPYNCLTHPML